MRIMAAGKFKAHCLAVLDEVQAKRQPVIVTKRGVPVAKMVPMEREKNVNPLAEFLFPGKIVFHEDVVSSAYTDAELDEFEKSAMEPFL